MMPLKWLLSVLAAGALVALAFAFFPKQEEVGIPLMHEARKPQAEEPAQTRAFRAAPPVERVKVFYAAESRRIGAVDPDPAATQKRLEQVAALLNREELSWLQGEALGGKEADGRFFATYLLALSSVDGAQEVLRGIALSPLPKSKNQGLVELERQVRAQATEGLGRLCGAKPAARDALLDIVEKQEDEFLRDRAHRALYQCRTGKSVEAQDQEALGKVLYGK